jgi:FAD/FMN-containing dehydrogenase
MKSGDSGERARANLPPQLVALLGDACVLTDAASLRFHAQDVYGSGVPPLAVVRPGSVEELAAAVQLVTAAGAAVVARGGGMSYTDGYLPIRENTVTFDTTRLNRIVEINPRDRYVTVECGVTWKELAEALAPHALRTPYWGPLSGLRATVGGALSQGSIFLGSGLHGPVQESLLALEVVLADGSLLKTGGAALAHGVPFFRHFGPDLTSLFTGDCGAFGIKARATLRLIPAPAESRYLSFSLTDAEAVFGLMADVAREGLASECMAFDPGLQEVRMKRVSLAEDAKALGQVVRSAGGVLAGLKEGAKVVLAGRNFLDAGGFSVHLGVDGRDAADAESRCARIRALADGRAREVENTARRCSQPVKPSSRGMRRSSSDSASTTVASVAPSAAAACSSSRASTGRTPARRSTRRCSIRRTSRSCRSSRRTCGPGRSLRNCAANSRTCSRRAVPRASRSASSIGTAHRSMPARWRCSTRSSGSSIRAA